MNNEEYAARKARPLLFRRLHNNTKFRIIAEPTRGIRASNDQTVYVKVCDAYSTSLDGKKDIILYPNDVVQRV